MSASPVKRGAFFDVDYTLLSSNSVSLFVKYMRARGEIGTWEILTSLYYLAQYKLNLLDFEKIAQKEIAKMTGDSESEMIALCDGWFEEMVVHYIYPEGRETIEKHREEGDLLVLLSAASIYLVRPLADHLGIEHVLCNRPEVGGDGKYTGRLIYPICYGDGKLVLAREFAEIHGLDLSECYYYSDSITDLNVLEAFGEPRIVNPDPLLRKESRKREWPIIEFRMPRKEDE